MAYSIQREVSDGTLVLLDVSISYIERSEITVYFDNVFQTEGVTWDWVGTTDAKLSFTPAVPIGVEVTVRRGTDLADLRHRYSAGAAFTAGSIDESFEQVLHIAQEATESALGGDFFQDLDMHTYKIKNLGAAVDPMDAVPLAQYQADAAGASVARNEAVAAKNTAVAAKDTAVAAKDTAVASSTSAQTSASTATAQAGIATTKASEAAASAASALTSKNSATASATDATASKNAAAASATAAANSAAAALNPWQGISSTEIRYAGIVSVDTLRIAGADVTAALASKTPLDGVGATGTWPVSITGNAATATNATNLSSAGASTVSTGGVERMRIDTTGAIGLSGANYGTPGQALVSNGSGAAPSWQTISSGLTVASTAEARAGTIDTKAITPLKLREGLNASGSAPIYACRAWVNFNGTGTVAIRASGNVSSITDNGVGDYTVNFTTAMPDANYSVSLSCDGYLAGNYPTVLNTLAGGTYTTSAIRIYSAYSNTTAYQDVARAFVAIFR